MKTKTRKEVLRTALLLLVLFTSMSTWATSGYCGIDSENGGQNVSYELTGSAPKLTLTISGEGTLGPDQPWSQYNNDIRYVVIQEGITCISPDAFKGCSAVTDVYCHADPARLTWDDGDCDDFKGRRATICHVENAADWNRFSEKVNVRFVGGYCGSPSENGGKNLRWDVLSSSYTLKIFKNPDAPGSIFTMADDMDFGAKDFQGVIIEEGVRNIGMHTFEGFGAIRSITIPASVKRIGYCAFLSCSSLSTILVLSTTPPTLETDAFYDIPKNAVFTVRNSKYLSANGWKEMAENTGHYNNYHLTMNVLGDDFQKIPYIDAAGQSATSPLAIPLTGSTSDVVFSYSGDTWYYVSGAVEMSNDLWFDSRHGSTNLILCDGASLTIQGGIYAQNNLNIYAQSGGTGALSITNEGYTEKGIMTDSDITINGGTITVNATGDRSLGILNGGYDSDITINGGKVVAYGKTTGIHSSFGNINLGWTHFGDYICANSYSGKNIHIQDGKTFIYNNGQDLLDNTSIGADIAGKYLFPAVSEVTLQANSDDEGNYWTTFYCGHTSFMADANTTIYKGSVGEDKVLLSAVEDIPKGNAVILKSTEPAITLTLTEPKADFKDNDLQGTDIDMAPPAHTFCMSKGDNGEGFYPISSTDGTIPANRAYLTIADSPCTSIGLDDPFSGDDGYPPTGIAPLSPQRETILSPLGETEGASPYFDLQGRPVSRPTSPGLYISKGKKVKFRK
ncbi:MAG: leucine-rich repeat protein [Bacteroidaceae bacterium]|nr:leucine-rich repeat protein [Bacteroidaceae bacterium]